MSNETLQVSKASVLDEFNDAGKKTKATLTRIFGEKVFKGTIIERIQSYEDAYLELGADHKVVRENAIVLGEAKHISAFKKLCVIAEALREGVILDYTNLNQKKWYPWFEFKKGSGFGFSVSDFVYWTTNTNVGSRLSVDTSEKAKYMGTQFEPLYKDML